MPIEESTSAKLSVWEVRDVYARLAPLSWFWERWAEGKARRSALELAGARNGEKVLEIAVGRGSALEQLARGNPAGTTIGADLTSAMLQQTLRLFRRRLLPPPALCQCDGRFLPFRDASFDLVVSSYLLDLLSVYDIARTLEEMRRVLKPSGRLVLVNLSLAHPWFNRLWGVLYFIFPNLLGGCRPIRLASYLPEAGFTVEEVRRVSERGIPSEVILARCGRSREQG